MADYFDFDKFEKAQLAKHTNYSTATPEMRNGYHAFTRHWRGLTINAAYRANEQQDNPNSRSWRCRAVKAWRDLTDAQRDNWISSARIQRATDARRLLAEHAQTHQLTLPNPLTHTFLEEEWTYWIGLPADQRLPYIAWAESLVGNPAQAIMTAGQRMAEWLRNNGTLFQRNDWPEYGDELIGDIAEYNIENARQEATRIAPLTATRAALLEEAARREGERREAERREAERHEAEEQRHNEPEEDQEGHNERMSSPSTRAVSPNSDDDYEPATDEDDIYAKVKRGQQKLKEDEKLTWKFLRTLHSVRDKHDSQVSAMLYVGDDAEGYARDVSLSYI
jgi:hypothetical protein